MATSCQNEYDFYIISDDEAWEKKVISELEERRQGIRCYSRRDHIPGKKILDNFIDGVNKCKKVVVGYTSTSTTGYLTLVTDNALLKMVHKNILDSGKIIPVKITPDAIIPDTLNIFSPANGWEDSFYEKLLDGENIEMKISEKQSEAGSRKNSECFEHLNKCFEDIASLRVSEVPHARSIIIKITEYLSANGIDIRGVKIGSIIFNLCVYDTNNLMNLWDMHLSGQLIKDLSKILVPEDLQELFLERWMTEIDEAEYKFTLSKLTEKDQFWAIEDTLSVEDFHQRVPEMAHQFSFELDRFQKQAILHLEKKESVFVVAHTSAGKTVVAEYALALSCKHGTKAIYTSPIKALSNQKYRDFKNSLGGEHVGLQTGDVQINVEASCVIMTTEILRSKLYNPEDLRGLEWVIFDEVHYINDKSRGVVWEEALIMLPKTVNLVLLSATFSNTMEFANWIAKIKKKSIYVIRTAERPVPLQHFVYTGTEEIAENRLFKTVDVTGDFNNEGYERALMAIDDNITPKKAGISDVKHKNWYLSFVKMLEKDGYLPAIVFTFTRKKCSENAMFLQSHDLTTRGEKDKIQRFLKSSLQNLPKSNQTLSQITELKEMLKRGIGYHHSGVLPRMKEIVEQLFQDGLVKVLFATETFASGVNMPARTVIFNSIAKYDGEEVRPLNPGEYIQMAGRAGRRGIDDTGFSIIVCKSDKPGDKPQISALKSLQQGKPYPVESQFHLKDNMILNLANRAKLQVPDVLRQSFAEYSRDSTEKELVSLKQKLNDMEPVPCGFCKNDLKDYYDACKEIHSLKSDLKYKCRFYTQPSGQVVVVDSRKYNHVLGIIISKVAPDLKMFKSLVIYDEKSPMGEHKSKLKVPMVSNTKLYLPKDLSKSCVVVELEAGDFVVTGKKIEDAESLFPFSRFTKDAVKILNDCVKNEFPNFKFQCLQCKNLHKHYEIHEKQEELKEKIEVVKKKKERCLLLLLPQFQQRQEYEIHEKQQELKEKIDEVEKKLSERSLLLLPQFQQRQEVLKSLNYFNDNMEIQQKGIVACKFSRHEVLLTEIIFENILDDLEPHEIASALSCMVYHGKEPSEITIDRNVKKVIQDIKSIARRLAYHEKKYDEDFDVKDYVDQFKQGFANVVFEWAKGKPFEDIRHLAGEILDGEIVHTMQQLIYICREIRNACRVIQNVCEADKSAFAYKVKRASHKLKRDIMAVPSLYLPSDYIPTDGDSDSDTDIDLH